MSTGTTDECGASWQRAALSAIEAAAIRRGAVRVHAFGSLITGQVDEWSDLDVLVVVPDGRIAAVWPDCTWIPEFEIEIAASKQWRAPGSGFATQLLLADGRHVDLMMVEASLADERMAMLADLRPVVDTSTVEELANGLIFDATDVVKRVARGERLIATHLALSLFGRCLELAMVIRDIATGTCVHPRADATDVVVDRLPGVPTAPKPTDLLRMITEALDCFEDLLKLSPFDPVPFRRDVVDRLVARAIAALG